MLVTACAMIVYMADMNNVSSNNINAPARILKCERKLCEWCGRPAHHEFQSPDLTLCCACTDVAIENSVFVCVPNQSVPEDALDPEQYAAVMQLTRRSKNYEGKHA